MPFCHLEVILLIIWCTFFNSSIVYTKTWKTSRDTVEFFCSGFKTHSPGALPVEL